MRTVASELVTTLQDEGVTHLFVNPGMFTAPLREAVAEAVRLGVPHPEPVLCVHEHVALCAAHGHHLLSGGPQAVMVHVADGHLSFDGVVLNAHRCRVPLTVFDGDGGEWAVGAPDRPAPVPGVESEPGLLVTPAKWAANLSAATDPGMVVRRAFQIARTEPAGLTRVALPVELLGRPAGLPSRRLPPPRPPAPDLTGLGAIADLLAKAHWPVIMAGRVGRSLGAVHHLARLAETLGAPVIDIRNNVNLPIGHALNAGLDARELVDRADAVVLVDTDVQCVPGLGPAPAGAWHVQIDLDCVKSAWPGWSRPVEVAVTADSEVALPQLVALLQDRLGARRRRAHDRRHKVERELRHLHVLWRERAASSALEDRGDAVMSELNRWLPEDAVIVEEVASGVGCTMRQLQRAPGHLFRSRSPGPGWSMGAALGARLARPNQPVVAICDDGAFASSLPNAAFWSAHRAGAPFLTVVLDRSGERSGSEQDVASIARASGAEVAVVNAPAVVAEALERLLATTRDGVCTVMSVRLPATRNDDARPRRRRPPMTTASTVTRRQPA